MRKTLLLWVKSAYSFSWGTDLPESLVEEAERCGFGGVMLADTAGVYGQHRFAAAAVKAGIKGIAGVEIETTGGLVVTGALSSGWGQLCRLITSVHLEERIDHLKAFSDSSHLFCIVKDGVQGTSAIDKGWKGLVYTPVLPGQPDPDCPDGVLPIACFPSMYTGGNSPLIHSILRKADELLPSPHVQKSPLFSCRNHLPLHSSELWRAAPFALENNLRLSEFVCTLPVQSSYRPPVISDDDSARLKEILLPRLREAYGNSEAAERRLNDELRELTGAGLCGYFLVFHRIVTYCRESGILAIARGSAAGSLVSRLLGLSAICPIRYGLSFSRFFNRLRDDPPDIDLDIDGSRRDKVYKWFLNEWGERTAAVSATVTYRTKSAVRVAAAACGVSRDETDVLAKLSRNPWNPIWKQPLPAKVMEQAQLLKGIPSHLMPHPCGVVVGEGLIASTVPVEMCSGGLPVTQLDMYGVEYAGIIKMDLLGQRGLTSLSLAVGESDPVKLLDQNSFLNSRTLELINAGGTIGVPHIESPAMRGLLKRMNIRSVEDVARALALVRPGAASGGGRDKYMAGGERNIPAALRNILIENRGVMLYQENVTEAACALLGLSPAEGDFMRRRLKRRTVEREEIVSRCIQNGFSRDMAERGWELLSGYAGYGFCKAHSMTYAAVASAYATIKAERPAAAMASFLAAGGGFYRHSVYIEEARRLGLKILPPDVNRCEWFCTSPDDNSLMMGLGFLAGMGETEYEKIRKGRPYSHPVQIRSTGIRLKLARNMAMAGCFDSMGMNRPQAAWCIKEGASSLFQLGMPPPPLPAYCPSVRASKELELLEVTIEAHPLLFKSRPAGTICIADMPGRGDSLIWGRVLTGRSLKGEAGFFMLEDETGVVDVFVPSPWYRKALIILRQSEATLTLRCEKKAERTVVHKVLE
ncbi:MAG: PHP domain-containing protein [Candidatus Sabulitectum sp.]|nr:PHP domain-containing protein [Candidatus Sabulitectum sp.]